MSAWEVVTGDSLEYLRTLPDCSIDACVTDPPYGLAFMGKRWDYDVPSTELWAEVYRVLKPGAHLLAFAGTRTQHRMAVRIEDAGFQIRDMIAWVYGSGFPKSLDVSKQIDRSRSEDIEPTRVVCRVIRSAMDARGIKSRDLVPYFGGCHPRLIDHWAARDTDSQPALPTPSQWAILRRTLNIDDAAIDAEVKRLNNRKGTPGDGWQSRGSSGKYEARAAASRWRTRYSGGEADPATQKKDVPATPDAQRWQGWGTALKPALEPITVARKPFKQTVARNVLEHGTGAINVAGCRVGESVYTQEQWDQKSLARTTGQALGVMKPSRNPAPPGRWPANLIHDGSDEVTRLFPGDDGEDVARFFYCAKASKADRDHGLDAMPIRAGHERCERAEGSAGVTGRAGARGSARNMHPTVKPTDLMRYLCRLVTPPGGRVLDPFTGSGSTGRGAVLEGFDFLGIELDPEHAETARLRIAPVGDYDPRYAIRETSDGQMGLFGGEE